MAVERQAETIRRILESERVDLHTGAPGRIRNYNREKQTADVEIQLKRVIPVGDEDEPDQVEDYPILPGVPIVFPRGGGFYITWPLEDGDGCWVAYAESDMSAWLESGQVSDPGVSTRHGMSSAVAFPGIDYNGARLTDVDSEMGLRLGSQGGQRIEILPGQIKIGSSAGQSAVKGDDQATALKNVLDAINTFAQTLSVAVPAAPNGALTVAAVLAAYTPLNTAITNAKTAIDNALSNVVTVE